MYKHAYNFIREILNDDTLNNYILDITGKHLTVIDAGAKITAPCASISLNSGSVTRKFNSNYEIEFLIAFALPLWDAEAFDKCIDFLDFVIPIFFEYVDKNNFILRITPSINEIGQEDSQLWYVNLSVAVSTLF